MFKIQTKPNQTKKKLQLDVVFHTCNLRAEVGGSQEFEASIGFRMTFHVKN